MAAFDGLLLLRGGKSRTPHRRPRGSPSLRSCPRCLASWPRPIPTFHVVIFWSRSSVRFAPGRDCSFAVDAARSTKLPSSPLPFVLTSRYTPLRTQGDPDAPHATPDVVVIGSRCRIIP